MTPSRCSTPAEPGATLRLQLQAQMAAVETARLAALHFFDEGRLTPRARYRLELVLEEVLMNVARHGATAAHPLLVDLTLERGPGLLHLVFEDEGPAFDPTAAPLPGAAGSLSELVPGGRGLLLLRRSVRRMHYQRVGTRNRLEVDLDPA